MEVLIEVAVIYVRCSYRHHQLMRAIITVIIIIIITAIIIIIITLIIQLPITLSLSLTSTTIQPIDVDNHHG